MEKQVLIIFAATHGFVDDYPEDALRRFEDEMYTFFDAKYPDLMDEIRKQGALSGDLERQANKALEDFKKSFVVS